MSRNRWLDWKPHDQKFEDPLRGEATKTTKTPETPSEGVFVGFVGTPQTESSNFQAEPQVEVSPKKLAEFQPFLDELAEAGIGIKRISDRKQPKGMTMDEWKCREAQRMCAEYLRTLPKLPQNIQRRERGETAIFYRAGYPYEWNHSAKGFTGAFWKQISEETAKGAKIQVISWPLGNLIYSSDTDAASTEPPPPQHEEGPEPEHSPD
jgi:hypothetical protein